MSTGEGSFNQRNIEEFRATGGTVASFGDAPLLLLTTVGARSGRERVSPMMYRADAADPDVVFVFGSNGGLPAHPAWYHNLVANPGSVVVEIGRETVAARPRVLDEPDRSRVYDEQAADYPGFVGYREATDRVIPVVALHLRRDGGDRS